VAVDGDASGLHAVSSALHRLQLLHGVIPTVRCKGVLARKIMQQLSHLRSSRAHEPLFRFGVSGEEGMYRVGVDVDVDEDDDDDDDDDEGDVDDEGDKDTTGAGNHEGAPVAAGAGDTTASSTADNSTDAAGAAGAAAATIQKAAKRRPVRLDALFIVDRDLDLISPLVTPLTYEGLVAEFISDEYGTVQDETSTATTLDDEDPIYAEIRHLSIEHIGPNLQAKAIDVKKRYADFRGNKDASIAEIHDFVKQMPQLTKQYQSLNMHIGLAHTLKQQTEARAFRERWQLERGILEGDLSTSTNVDLIEDFLVSHCCTAAPDGAGSVKLLCSVLRLLCLQSLVAGGIRASKFDAMRRLIVQTFGYRHAITLRNLEKAGAYSQSLFFCYVRRRVFHLFYLSVAHPKACCAERKTSRCSVWTPSLPNLSLRWRTS
jgi:hypothetical protein